jgi:prepilin-type N-terminal cleavage/methylation domain-containing protein
MHEVRSRKIGKRGERGNRHGRSTAKGFSLPELCVVILIALIIAGIAIPSAIQTWYNMQLRSASAEVANLMQQTRMLAAKNNATYPIRYNVLNGVQRIFIDLNNNGTLDAGEPFIDLGRQIIAAAGAPTGSGQPTPYALPGDTTSGTPCDNTCILAFSSRGLPCNYTNPPTCTTPSPSYFVYYFQDGRPNGWTAVYVTKAGRSKSVLWSGTSWN